MVISCDSVMSDEVMNDGWESKIGREGWWDSDSQVSVQTTGFSPWLSRG
jgi:hypothetical protein